MSHEQRILTQNIMKNNNYIIVAAVFLCLQSVLFISSYTITSIPVNVYSHNDYSLNTTEVRITVHPSIPSVHQNISSVHQNISSVHQLTPSVHQLTPSVHQLTPSVHQNISSVHQLTPSVNQCTPSVLSYPLFNHSWIDKKM